MNTERNLYFVRKPGCVAYLKLKGFEVVSTDIKDGVVYFYLEDTAELRQAKEAYYKDEFLQNYDKTLREIKKEVYELKNAGGSVRQQIQQGVE